MVTISDDIKEDVYNGSAGCCWDAWAQEVGLKKKKGTVKTLSGKTIDLADWSTCPRTWQANRCEHWKQKDKRICVAHYLVAGSHKPPSENCSCETDVIFNYGCQCGGT
jgi:hypothetical protein